MYVLALVGVITPTMKLPSGVRSSLPGKVVVGRPVGCAGSGARVVVSAGTATSVSVLDTGSNTCSVFCGTPAVTPVPVMAISTRPSMPVSTPCGVEGSVWLYAMRLVVRSIAYSAEGGPLAVTYRKLPSIDMAPASGVLPVGNLGDHLIRRVVVNQHLAGGVADQVELVPQLVQHDVGGGAALQLDHIAEGRAHRLLRVRRLPRRKPEADRQHTNLTPVVHRQFFPSGRGGFSPSLA